MSDRVEQVKVEIQIRTIAMDFWATLEHKIYYKYHRAVPEHLIAELRDAALTAHRLDEKMERLHDEVIALREVPGADDGVIDAHDIGRSHVPEALLRMLAASRSDSERRPPEA